MKALRLTCAELGRLRRRKTTLLMLVLPALVGGLRVWLHARASTELDAEAAAVAVSGFAPMADGLKAGGAVLTLVLLLAGSLLIVREREAGTLALESLIGSRVTVFTSKLLTMVAVLILAGLLLVASCTGAAAWWFDLGPLMEDGYEMATAGELWSDVRGALAAALAAWLATVCFALLVSASVSGAGAAVTVALIPLVLFDFLHGLLGEAWQKLFLVHVPFFGDGPALARLPEIARGYSDVFYEPGEIAAACTVSLAQALVMLALGSLVTRMRTPV